MANHSNTAYDTASSVSQAVPAKVNVKKLMQEKRVSQSPAAAAEANHVPTQGAHEPIETRFGVVAFNVAKPVHFTRGLLGMHDRQQFALADFPNPKFAQFKLLQSMDEAALSFITMPLELQPDLIRKEDLQRAADDVGIALDDLAVLLIVTVNRMPPTDGKENQVQISVNTRAPLIFDTSSRQAVQYVFPHDRYQVQQVLGAQSRS